MIRRRTPTSIAIPSRPTVSLGTAALEAALRTVAPIRGATPRLAPALLLATSLLLAPSASAQELPFGPNALVLGASRDATLCGIDLLDPNAAGLTGECGRPVARFRMVFPPTVAGGWFSNGPDGVIADEIGTIFEGVDNELDFEFTDSDRRAIIDGIPGDGWELDGTFRFPLVAFAIGRVGVEVSRTLQLEGTLPRDLVALILEGRDPDRDDYHIGAFGLSVLGVSRYSVGYARALRPGWTVGGSASLHTGTINGYYEAGPVTYDDATGEAVFDLTGGFAGGAALEGELFGFRLPDGAGLSLDVGTRWTRSGVTVAVAAENLLSGMWWPERTLVTRTRVRAAPDGDLAVEADTDTLASPTGAVATIRDGIEAYRPALRVRTAVAYRLDALTIGFGHVLEPGDGLLYATGDGWDLGLALHPWEPLAVQASVGRWRDEATLGAGLSLTLGSFLFQGGLKRSAAGSQAAVSIGLVQ